MKQPDLFDSDYSLVFIIILLSLCKYSETSIHDLNVPYNSALGEP